MQGIRVRLGTTSVLAVAVVLIACGGPASTTAPSPMPGVQIAKLEVDASVTGGQVAHGTVTLSDPAPQSGLAVTLASDNPALTIPSLLTIPAGATSGSFDIATTRVSIASDVTISAETGGARRTASLRLKIDPAGLTPTARYTLGFSALRENRAAFTTSAESGFTVSIVSADWLAITTYGNPQPSIQFYSPAGTTMTGEIRITAGGAPFWLSSLDFYSSTTKIPYVIEGSLSADPMFTVINVLGNTFGAFVRTANPRADTPVDALVIRLSNPSAPCCSNPMGVDNIVLSR